MALRKVKISYIGQPKDIKTKYGTKQKFGIKTEQKPDLWLNGFANAMTEKWKVGDEVEIDITKSEYNGKTYYNFKAPSAKVSRKEFDELVGRINKIEKQLGLDEAEKQDYPAY